MAEGNTLVSVDYEIFGKVQKVFFRKYTQVCCPIALKRCRGAILGDGMRPCSDKWEFGEAGSLVASRGQLRLEMSNGLRWFCSL